jgi:hypothetical protein
VPSNEWDAITDLLERLIADLDRDGWSARLVPGGILVERRDNPPDMIFADNTSLAEYLAGAEDDGRHLWPQDPPAHGAWRLLLTNLDEALAVRGTAIRVEHGSVRWDPPPLRRDLPQDGGDYMWSERRGGTH